MPAACLNKYRDGLISTSACEAGELYRAAVVGRVLRGIEEDRLLRRAEIQPLGNNEYRAGRQGGERGSHQGLQPHHHPLGEDLHKPGRHATGDAFTEPEDAIYRTVLQAGNGFGMRTLQPPLFYRTRRIC